MNAAERRQLLGEAVIADIHRQVAAAPPPTPELLGRLRRILTHPARRADTDAPAAARAA